MGYEYPLEWIEGGVVDEVARAMAGRPLYAAPSLDYVAYVYTPLYFYTAAAVAAALGLELWAARLVSLFATLGSGALLLAFVRGELARQGIVQGIRRYGWVGAGLFLASFDLTGKWFHLARVDALFLFLLLAGAYVFRFGGSWIGAVGAGLLFGAACLTKQAALAACLPLIAACLVTRRRRALLTAGALGAVLVLSTIGFELASDGWYGYFVLELPARHGVVPERFLTFWTQDLARLGIGVAGSLVALWLLRRRDPAAALFYAGLLAGFVGSSYGARLRPAAWVNSLLPAAAAVAILMPLAIGLARARPTLVSDRAGRCLGIALPAALVVQLLLLAYDPRAAVPDEADRRAGDRFLRYIASIEGEVLIPQLRFVQTRVGKRSFGLDIAADDVLRAPEHPARRQLLSEIQDAVRSRRFAAIILHDDGWARRIPRFGAYYAFEEDLFGGTTPFRPVTGYYMRPTRVHLRRRGLAEAPDPSLRSAPAPRRPSGSAAPAPPPGPR